MANQASPFQIMLVDDASVVRGVIARWIEADNDMEVAVSVANGEMAVSALRNHKEIDLIILDIEMPVMDGLTALPLLTQINPSVPIIMASTLTRRNAEISFKALELGAKDYLPKPSSMERSDGLQTFQQELLQKIRFWASAKRGIRPDAPAALAKTIIDKTGMTTKSSSATAEFSLRPMPKTPPKALAIGSSTGGPQALTNFFQKLTPPFPLPIFVTQHMPATFTTILAERLSRETPHQCVEAQDGMIVEAGKIYLAAGGKHMTIVKRDGTSQAIRLTDEPPENFCRPSIEPMIRSLNTLYGKDLLMIMLTGMGQDGLKSTKNLVESGGYAFAQDKESSVVWGMPGVVAMAGLCSLVAPIETLVRETEKLLSINGEKAKQSL